jgi:leukotriene-A4 hydrolase
MNSDLSSHAKPEEAVVTHLDWDATVNFEDKTIAATATYTIHRVDPTASKLCLDTSNLRIQSVLTFDGIPLSYKLHGPTKGKSHLGQKLEICLPEHSSPAGDAIGASEHTEQFQVTIVYETTPECSAVQWLPPSQTAGKKYPYLFTQCQAIHARALLPCQDRCGVKMTYKASVTVPSWSTCVMSALHENTTKVDSDKKEFVWNQPVPISSYLFAIAVGELERKDLSKRCAIWSEPSMLEAAAYEFAETEQFLEIAEDLSGMKYAWGRYDLLCLPPSFPYGGMENPNLTFVTPTLLAGDRSLADVVAHEIAHSWTGNLVTNATWDHFWLNEGCTTWFQRKIMARIHDNPKFLDFDAIGGRKDLQDTVDELPKEHTTLVLDVGDEDPDDSYSAVAYEKGFTLLLSLERRVGTEAFEKFFAAYMKRFASKTLTSTDFKDFFMEHFKGNRAVQDVDWDTWFYKPGMPDELPELDTTMAKDSQDLADTWLIVDRDRVIPPATNHISGWTSLQIQIFLDTLLAKTSSKSLKLSTLHAMDSLYQFSKCQNSEILFRYCMLAIASEDNSVLPVVVRFITTQGRMKFVRPLYKALFKSRMGRDLAVSTFLANKDFYHPIAAKMLASDLRESRSTLSLSNNPALAVGVAATAVAVGFVLMRRRR